MQSSFVDEALGADTVFFSFTDQAVADAAFELGRVAVTFDYLGIDEIISGYPGVFGSTLDATWAHAIVNAAPGSAVVTRRNRHELWWATFSDDGIQDAGDYKFRNTRSGWHLIQASDSELGALKGWRQARTFAQKGAGILNPIEAFHSAVQVRKPKSPGLSLRSALVLAKRAFSAHRQSGKKKTGVYKDKLLGFESPEALAAFILKKFDEQEGRCALTDRPMLEIDAGMTPLERDCEVSLDRIASDDGYSPDNLQAVCSFANSWKSDTDNDHFAALLALVRQPLGPGQLSARDS